MRLKLDENVTVAAKDVFAEHGADVETVDDEGLAGAKDPSIMAACRAERRL